MKVVKQLAWLVAVAVLAGCGASSTPAAKPAASKPAPSSAGAGSASAAKSTAAPFKIGFISPETGYLAAPGKFMQEGFNLYLKQHGGKFAGRPIQVVTADGQGNPTTTLTQARKLVEQDHVNLLFGVLNAAAASALKPYIASQKIPTIFPIDSSDNLTQRARSPWIIRTGWTSSQTTQPLGDYAYKTLHYRKVATIAYDFEFGWQSVGGFMATFQGDGGKVVKMIWTPQTTTDFSPYLSQIPHNVDAVMCSFSGSTAINFFKQYKQFGLKMPLVCQGNATDESTLPQTGKAALGVVTAMQYSAALNTPANKKFVAAYNQAYGHVPSYYSDGTYLGAMVLNHAMTALHGNTSDTQAFLKAMRAVQLPDAPRGSWKLDSYGNPIQNVYIRKVEAAGGQVENVVTHTYPNVSQFWTFNPQQFLKHPVYSRTYPPCNACTAG